MVSLDNNVVSDKTIVIPRIYVASLVVGSTWSGTPNDKL